MTEPLWSDQRIEKSTYSDSTVEKLKLMRNEYEAELEKARAELAAANAKVAELTDKLRSEGYDV